MSNATTKSHITMVLIACLAASGAAHGPLEVAGVTVTPHVMAPTMQYRHDPDPELGARVQVFLRNASSESLRFDAASPVRLRGSTPEELLSADQWTWHDLPSAWPERPLVLPPGALTVWSFNGKGAAWGADTAAELEIATHPSDEVQRLSIAMPSPDVWMSAITFLSTDDESVYPDTLIAHVENRTNAPLRIVDLRLWLPAGNDTWRALRAGETFREIETWPADRRIPAGDKGILRIATGTLPLTYAAAELQVEDASKRVRSVWSHLRIKREAFDISGGWVHDGRTGGQSMTFEPFLKTLHRMHINAAHMADQFPGYTDQLDEGGLYARYPLKYFSKLPPERYDRDDLLPRIHAVEFLGEPQYGGGRPVPPMEVWRELAPYQASRLATTLTHSEERIWRYYAGLSDYPHYDAYRVSAPSPDAWRKYDRWEGVRIGWGAPLETIGEMSRSLRELNRPMPTAYWSQGPHAGWGVYDRRRRTSPTPDELRLQAYHALSSRITSLYWFNLSLPSLLKFRDTLDELTRVGRECRLLEDFYLQGDAYRFEQRLRDGKLDWDLASIVAPQGALLFALDLNYVPDQQERVFRFGPPRAASFRFALPAWLSRPVEVFRVDGDGVNDVAHEMGDGGITITDTISKVGIYVAAARPGLREELAARRQELLAYEHSFEFDPAGNDDDFDVLVKFFDQLRSQ